MLVCLASSGDGATIARGGSAGHALVWRAAVQGPPQRHYAIERSGGRVRVLDTSTGKQVAESALAGLRSISLYGANGPVDNTLTVDLGGGPIAVPGGLSWDGGVGGFNSLAITGGRATREESIPSSAHAGTVAIDATTISYDHIAPITDTSASPTFDLDVPPGTATIDVSDGPLVSANQTLQISGEDGSGQPNFETVDVANKTAVVVNEDDPAGTPLWQIDVPTAPAGLSQLTVNGGTGANTFMVGSTPPAMALSVNPGSGTGSVELSGSAAQAIAGPVTVDASGPTALVLDNTGAVDGLKLTTADSYTGTTTVTGTSEAEAEVAGAIPPTSDVIINSGASLRFGATSTIGSLAGAGDVSLGANVLIFGNTRSTVFSGVVSGSGLLAKTGSGTFTLSGTSIDTGTTEVYEGDLTVSGTVDGPVSVENGARITCSGTIDGLVTVATGGTVISNGCTLGGGLAGAGVPSAPTGVTASAGNTEVAVSFTAPPSNGSPITSYTVTASPGGRQATGSTSPITLTGLSDGQSYTFTVTATNSLGTGPASSATRPVTPSRPTLSTSTTTSRPPAPKPRLNLPNATADVHGAKVAVAITCEGAPCIGTLTLGGSKTISVRKGKKTVRQHEAVTYGASRYSARPGKTISVTVTLNAEGLGALHRAKNEHLPVTAAATVKSGLTRRRTILLEIAPAKPTKRADPL